MLATIERAESTIALDDRWQAVATRDRSRDGEFVFGVRTTVIYCRPSCPARRPRPEHVRFFSSAESAERAGFRPCRRCQPRAAVAPRDALVASALAWLDAHAEERVTLSTLAAALEVSPGHLQRMFTAVVGVSPRQYAAARRLEATKTRLRQGATVTSALHEAGYGSSSRFYADARSALGMTPTAYKSGGAGLTISYAMGQSPLGRVLVAATARGVCAVSLGADDTALLAALAHEYPRAAIQQDEQAVAPWLHAILAHLRHRSPLPALPLDVQGSPFQRRVWQALQAIPVGQTRSYAEIANAIGNPKAVRAVARACAANPVSLVIPCHRVLRADGALGGYRWGTDRKRALLATEGG
jgi:AraC family transcriptional regulator of adaptative response/methylated-DNA-[protein]-cysteine methyltransferase